jgi:hypothetical protein
MDRYRTEMYPDPALSLNRQALDADPDPYSDPDLQHRKNELPVIFAFLFVSCKKHGKYSWTTVG